MLVSVEVLAIVISAATLMLGLGSTFVAGFAWMIRRIDGVEQKLGDRIDGVEQKLGERIGGVERELVEVKIAIARIEGPPRHLTPIR